MKLDQGSSGVRKAVKGIELSFMPSCIRVRTSTAKSGQGIRHDMLFPWLMAEI